MNIDGFDIYIKHPVPCVKKVRRSIKERLFSLPFRPFKVTKEVTEFHDSLSDGEIIRSGNRIFCNAFTYEMLRKEQSK